MVQGLAMIGGVGTRKKTDERRSLSMKVEEAQIAYEFLSMAILHTISVSFLR